MTELLSRHVYKSSWRQPEDVDRYLRTKITGKSLNVCSGESPLGDLQLDADRDHEPNVLGDMNNLPFRDASFDTVVFDPPWKLGYYNRQKSFFECVRVCKPDGKVLYNARWIGESKLTVLDEVVVRADDSWANVSTIAIHHKQPGQTEL